MLTDKRATSRRTSLRALSFSAAMRILASARILSASSRASTLACSTKAFLASVASFMIADCSFRASSTIFECSSTSADILASTSFASFRDFPMALSLFSTIDVIIGNPNFAKRKNRRPKIMTIQKRRPLSGVTRLISYLITTAKRHTIIAKRAAPSTIPAATIMEERRLPADSG